MENLKKLGEYFDGVSILMSNGNGVSSTKGDKNLMRRKVGLEEPSSNARSGAEDESSPSSLSDWEAASSGEEMEEIVPLEGERIITKLSTINGSSLDKDFEGIRDIYNEAEELALEFLDCKRMNPDLKLQDFIARIVDNYLDKIVNIRAAGRESQIDAERKSISQGLDVLFERVDWSGIETKVVGEYGRSIAPGEKENLEDHTRFLMESLGADEEDIVDLEEPLHHAMPAKEPIFTDIEQRKQNVKLFIVNVGDEIDLSTREAMEMFLLRNRRRAADHWLPNLVLRHLRSALAREAKKDLMVSCCGRMINAIVKFKEEDGEANRDAVSQLYAAAEDFATNYLKYEEGHPEVLLSWFVSNCVANYFTSQCSMEDGNEEGAGNVQVRCAEILKKINFRKFQEGALVDIVRGMSSSGHFEKEGEKESEGACDESTEARRRSADSVGKLMVDVDEDDQDAVKTDLCGFILANEEKAVRYWLPALVVSQLRKTLLSPLPNSLHLNLRALKHMRLVDLEKLYSVLDGSHDAVKELQNDLSTDDVADYFENLKWRAQEAIYFDYMGPLIGHLEDQFAKDSLLRSYGSFRMKRKVENFVSTFNKKSRLESLKIDVSDERDLARIFQLALLYVDVEKVTLSRQLKAFLQGLTPTQFEHFSSATSILTISDRSPLSRRCNLINEFIGEETQRRLREATEKKAARGPKDKKSSTSSGFNFGALMSSIVSSVPGQGVHQKQPEDINRDL